MSLADLAADREDRQRLQTFMRYQKADAIAKLAGFGQGARQVFEELHPRSIHLDVVRRFDPYTRAAVPGGGSGTWLAPFTAQTIFPDAFATEVYRRSALGQLGAVEVPPNIKAPYPSGPASASWVGSGQSIPISAGAFADIFLIPLMLAGITVASNEVIRATGPKAEAIFSALLVNAAVAALDAALLDPGNAGEPEIAPPSITNAAFSVPSSGSTVAALNSDLGLIADNMAANGVTLIRPVILLSPGSALRLGGISLPGPSGPLSVPIVQTPGALDQVVLIDASLLAYCDGGIVVDVATATSLEMSDTPSGDSTTPAPTSAPMVSLFDTNSVGFRLVEYVNWKLATPAAVGLVTGFGAPTP